MCLGHAVPHLSPGCYTTSCCRTSGRDISPLDYAQPGGHTMLRSLRYLFGALLAALALTASTAITQHGAKDGEWRSYAGDNGSTRYAPHDQITRANAKDLQVAWSWKFDNFGGGTSETTPLMANGVLYFTVGPRRNVIAVNPGTGETLWTWRIDEGERFDKAPRKVGRGIGYWTDGPAGNDVRIV